MLAVGRLGSGSRTTTGWTVLRDGKILQDRVRNVWHKYICYTKTHICTHARACAHVRTHTQTNTHTYTHVFTYIHIRVVCVIISIILLSIV